MQTFTKTERLSSQLAIDHLFEKGKSFHSPSFRIVWLEVNSIPSPVQLVISVPKRLFKKAVDRNKLKRIIREVYRKNKKGFYEKLGDRKIHLMYIYTSKKIESYQEIEEKVISTFARIIEKIN